jgi:hypothetical protein
MLIKFVPKQGLEIQLEAATQVDAITQMSQLGEIFGIKSCGACGSEDIRWQVRKVSKQVGKKIENYEYIELVCNKCKARLSFGRFSDDPNSVFPKKKDAEGNWLKNNGWVKWEGGGKGKVETDTEETSEPGPGDVGF